MAGQFLAINVSPKSIPIAIPIPTPRRMRLKQKPPLLLRRFWKDPSPGCSDSSPPESLGVPLMPLPGGTRRFRWPPRQCGQATSGLATAETPPGWRFLDKTGPNARMSLRRHWHLRDLRFGLPGCPRARPAEPQPQTPTRSGGPRRAGICSSPPRVVYCPPPASDYSGPVAVCPRSISVSSNRL